MYSLVLVVVACVRKSEKECVCTMQALCNVFNTDTVDCFAKIFS